MNEKHQIMFLMKEFSLSYLNRAGGPVMFKLFWILSCFEKRGSSYVLNEEDPVMFLIMRNPMILEGGGYCFVLNEEDHVMELCYVLKSMMLRIRGILIWFM